MALLSQRGKNFMRKRHNAGQIRPRPTSLLSGDLESRFKVLWRQKLTWKMKNSGKKF
jgi:hypothetical protein